MQAPKFRIKFVASLLVLIFSLTTATLSAQSSSVISNEKNKQRTVRVHFQFDPSTELKNIKSLSSLGIRGNIAPLSWDKTYQINDDNKDGVFETLIDFETASEVLRLEYKYFHDSSSWEKIDNRFVSIRGDMVKLPVDKWSKPLRINTRAYHDSVWSKELHSIITALDSKVFGAYNTCDLETYASLFSENLEFYHDKGGLSTSKKEMVEAVKNNICNKVRREVKAGSIEVSPVPGFGAIEIGLHRFHNLIERSTSRFSKFVIVWQEKDGAWKITRVISLH